MEIKSVLIFLAFVMILPCLMAANLDVEDKSSDVVMIADLNLPATFDIKVVNNQIYPESITINNLLGFLMEPNIVDLKAKEIKNIELKVYPREDLKYRGFYILPYIISVNGAKIENDLKFEIIDLKDAFEVGASEFNPESNKVTIYFLNKKNFDFPEINAEFSSAFFNFDKEFSLKPYERKTFEINLNREDYEKLLAGFYTMNADVEIMGKNETIEGNLKFVERDILKTNEDSYGFIINTKIIEKINEGNTVEKVSETIEKNIISRLFTSFSPEPDLIQRKGAKVYYTWNREVKPGEFLEIKVKTNWIFPIVIILFVAAIVYLARRIKTTDLILKKRINFVRARGGEFALKVTVVATAKSYLENISIVDRLPLLVKMHERFGGEMPSHVDEKTKRIQWKFNSLEAGETRSMVYVIYSKIGVLGRFALPSARATYEKEGKMRESESNKAFFVAEQKSAKDEE